MKRTKPDWQRLFQSSLMMSLSLEYWFWKLRLFGGRGFYPWQLTIPVHGILTSEKWQNKNIIFMYFTSACWLFLLRAQISSWAINLNSQTTLHFTLTQKANMCSFHALLLYFFNWLSFMEREDGSVWWLRTYSQKVMEALEFGDRPPLALS